MSIKLLMSVHGKSVTAKSFWHSGRIRERRYPLKTAIKVLLAVHREALWPKAWTVSPETISSSSQEKSFDVASKRNDFCS